LPLDLSSASRFSYAGRSRSHLSDRYWPLPSFALRRSHGPADPSRPGRSRPTPLMGFRSLRHIRAGRSTWSRPAGRLRSAFRVWLPSWRLTPAAPVPALFHAGGALGIHPSELCPPARYPAAFVAESAHVPFLLPYMPPPKRQPGPAGRGSWALTLASVPGGRLGVSTPSAGCSLGFRPSRAFRTQASTGLSPALLSRASPACRNTPPGASEYRSACTWSRPPTCGKPRRPDGTALLGFPHR